MLYRGPKTAGGWLKKIAIAAHKTRANTVAWVDAAAGGRPVPHCVGVSSISRRRRSVSVRPGVEKAKSSSDD